MDKHLLYQLKLYIEKSNTDDIIIEQEQPLAKNIKEEDQTWLEGFRKKNVDKVEEGNNYLYYGDLISEEEELLDYINKEKTKETFSTKLLHYIDRSRLSDSEIYKKAGIDRRHFSKIRCDKNYQPKKATAVALSIALQLSLKEATELLKLSGYSLSNSDTGDLVVKFCLERKIYDLFEVNEALEYFGQRVLGVVS